MILTFYEKNLLLFNRRIDKILHHKAFLILILAVQFFYLLLNIETVFYTDEGVAVYGSVRVANGEVPYSDFWTIYGVGQYYVLGTLFKLFGASIITERVWNAFLLLVIAFLIYLVILELNLRWVAFIVWTMTVVRFSSITSYGYPFYPALLFSLLSALILLKYFSKKQAIWLFGAGCSGAITLIFRPDFGVYTIVSTYIILLAFSYRFSSREKSKHLFQHFLSALKETRFFVVGVFIPTSLLVIFLITTNSFNDAWQDLFVFTVTKFHQYRGAPLPSVFPKNVESISLWFSFYVPLLVFGAALIIVIRNLFWIKSALIPKIKTWGLLLFIVLGISYLPQAWSRPDTIHCLPMFIAAFIVFLTLLPYLPHAIRGINFTKPISILLLAISVFYLIAASFNHILVLNRVPEGFWSTNCSIRTGCIELPSGELQAVEYVQAHTTADELIYVGDSRHDRVQAGDPAFYFFAQRNSATKYHELHPGIVTSLPVQKEIVGELQLHKVNYIVLFSGFENYVEWWNASGYSSGVTYLDDFIHSNYQKVVEFGFYSIWLKDAK